MPAIIVLSWNIENLGPVKITESNGEIFNLIACTIHEAKASLVALLEMSRDDKEITLVRQGLVVALQAATGNVWHSVFIDAQIKEGYLILWDTSVGFAPMPKSASATLGPGPHYSIAEVDAGLTENDGSGNRLSFPTENGTVGGRPAGYCTFQASGTRFTYIAFHAPGPGSSRSFTPAAGLQLAKAAQLALPTQTKVVLGGDFNVHLDATTSVNDYVLGKYHLTGPQTQVDMMYGSLTAATGPGLTRRTPSEETSLIREPHLVSAALARDNRTVACRANKYDHIFEKGLHGRTTGVIDMLQWLYAGEDIYRLNSTAFNNSIHGLGLTADQTRDLEGAIVNQNLSKREIQNIASSVCTKKVGSSGRVRIEIRKRDDVVRALTVPAHRRQKKTDTQGPLAGVVSNYAGKVAITTKMIGEGINQMAISSMFEGNGYELLSVYDRWLFYRYLVSDHLPVWLTITI